ncbi:2-oxo acid dehydrogenase subunit E2 [Macrococcus brunensis]|uniref:Dihydrolipoamide acetyltransferase component of pyruvate dehydrogenase complex n=1 Tax=Macrococcus brunensis TaxID=198483 RepID=A0A4R6BBB7_9STAP|nr:dihydrolipoamide acetyltransferase family protein [Macrococcus brunensis]TDL94271.1 2-oxo acid dehydrogenase subunit E2 [Macrococcus brunensis]
MAIKTIVLPGLGESVTEASITNWLVQPGDQVERYQPIAEATSDKVTTEIPSDFAGTVKELLVELDKDIPIHDPIMTIEVAGEQEEEEVAEDHDKSLNDDASAKDVPEEKHQMRYSPAVLKLSQERHIDLSQVTGTGRHGRITRKDILNFQPQKAAEKSETVTPAAATEVMQTDGVRKAIAKRMVQSVNEIPHAWMMVEADVTELVKLRNAHKTTFKEQEGISLSFYPFFIKAVAQALKKHPKMNASWVDNEITFFKDINISIAVATDDHLFVPVIRNADELSVKGIAKEVDRLAKAVRNNSLTSEQMQGGTITVNNTGSFGSVMSQGIINYPQAAILQIESINKRVIPTEEGGLKFADMINLCLSIDHRILDGLAAGRFLADVKSNLLQFNNESDIY